MHLVIISVPYTLNQSGVRISKAPAEWQAAGLAERLAPYVAQAVWVSLPPLSEAEATTQARLVALGRQLSDTVRTVCAAGAMPLVLGGDCLLTALGTVAGVQQAGKSPGIVWFDAHGDFNTPETSPSGLLVGMPLAMLAGRGELTLMKEIGVKRATPEWHIHLAGTRDLDPGEAAALEDSDVTVWSAQDLGIAGAGELGRGMAGSPPIYLHLDLDVIDPTIMPAVSYPSSGGLTLETLSAGIQAVAASGRICALGVASYCPERDENRQGLAASMEVIESALRASVD